MGCDSEDCIHSRAWYNFNPRTHRGVRHWEIWMVSPTLKFQSTHPSWGATSKEFAILLDGVNFNPRTHRGVRRKSYLWGDLIVQFQSTHPSWGATVAMSFLIFQSRFQSTHPSWGATANCKHGCLFFSISIHAPIVGCDFRSRSCLQQYPSFQSTHPSWGATKKSNAHEADISNFNPRTHRGVRRIIMELQDTIELIFQSTHPSWGATVLKHLLSYMCWERISIHAPIVGCDLRNMESFATNSWFQSTHPSWGATVHKHVRHT